MVKKKNQSIINTESDIIFSGETALGKVGINLPISEESHDYEIGMEIVIARYMSSIAFNQSGDKLAACMLGQEYTVIWDLNTGASTALNCKFPPSKKRNNEKLIGLNAFSSTHVSCDGNSIILSYIDNDRDPIVLGKIAKGLKVKTIAFSPNKKLAVAFNTGAIEVWDLKRNGSSRTLSKKSLAPIHSMKFNSSGSILIVHKAKKLEFYDIAQELRDDSFRQLIEAEINSFALSPSGILATAGMADTIILRSLESVVPPIILKSGNYGSVSSLAFSPSGSIITSIRGDEIEFWSVPVAKMICTVSFMNDDIYWYTPSDQIAKSGWFYTTSPDKIKVIRKYNDKAEILPIGDKSRERYINTYNNWEIIRARLNAPEKLSDFEKCIPKIRKEVKQELELMRHEVILLADGPDSKLLK